MEASGHARWFERLLAELNIELWLGDATVIRAKRARKPKTDRQDAQHILNLLLKEDFPQTWVPSWENRDMRQLLWHRHRMVQARTRIMNQLQAVALNEGLRCKKKLWREHGREQLEAFRLAPWASRRREDLLQLLDRLNPTIAELTQAIEREAEKSPQARHLLTHPGVGALTALAFVLIIGNAERFQCGLPPLRSKHYKHLAVLRMLRVPPLCRMLGGLLNSIRTLRWHTTGWAWLTTLWVKSNAPGNISPKHFSYATMPASVKDLSSLLTTTRP
jgi:transposase